MRKQYSKFLRADLMADQRMRAHRQFAISDLGMLSIVLVACVIAAGIFRACV